MRRLLPFIACVALALASCAVGVTPSSVGSDGGEDDGGGETTDAAAAVTDAAAKPTTDAGVRDAKVTDTSAPTVDSATDCPGYALPSETADCSACQSSSPTCQPNGCFNGYYCNLSSDKCGPKPSGC